jgi:hypothetical protein
LITFIYSWIWMLFRNTDNYRGSQFIIWLVVGMALAVKFRMRWECTAHRLYSCTVTGPDLMPLHIKRLLFIYYGMYLLICFSFPSARKSPTFFFFLVGALWACIQRILLRCYLLNWFRSVKKPRQTSASDDKLDSVFLNFIAVYFRQNDGLK